MANTMQQRRDTKSNWETLNTILKDGEIAFEIDKVPYKEKRGNGKLAWKDLPYVDSGGQPPSPVDPYVHPPTHPASMITETTDRLWFTPTEKNKLAGLGGDTPAYQPLKILYTSNNTFNVMQSGSYRITAVASGGGGSACQGQGGGSGESLDKVSALNPLDTVTFEFGIAGIGCGIFHNDYPLPADGTPYAGHDGGDTVITIKRFIGSQTEVIRLKGGKGGTCPRPNALQYAVGTGEQNGCGWTMNMFAGADTYWNGGQGGASIFGAGGQGGSFGYNDYSKTDGSDGVSYGAGGGGAGFRMKASAQLYSWTCSGDGIQGCAVLEKVG